MLFIPASTCAAAGVQEELDLEAADGLTVGALHGGRQGAQGATGTQTFEHTFESVDGTDADTSADAGACGLADGWEREIGGMGGLAALLAVAEHLRLCLCITCFFSQPSSGDAAGHYSSALLRMLCRS